MRGSTLNLNSKPTHQQQQQPQATRWTLKTPQTPQKPRKRPLSSPPLNRSSRSSKSRRPRQRNPSPSAGAAGSKARRRAGARDAAGEARKETPRTPRRQHVSPLLRIVEFLNPIVTKVEKLKGRKSGFTILLKVLSVEVTDKTSRSGEAFKYYDCLVGDETGCVQLVVPDFLLKGENFLENDNIIMIRNGKCFTREGSLKITIDKWGKLTHEAEAEVAEVDTENNLSIAKPKPEPVAEAVTAEVEAQETVAVEA